MEVTVVGKGLFDAAMKHHGITNENVESFNKFMFISVTDTLGFAEDPYFKENKSNVLNLFFDDVEDDDGDWEGMNIAGQTKSFTEEQATQIFDFIEKNKDKEFCIIHCYAGISRSGAVGAFVNDYFGGHYMDFIKANPQVQPNPKVTRLLNREWRKRQ